MDIKVVHLKMLCNAGAGPTRGPSGHLARQEALSRKCSRRGRTSLAVCRRINHRLEESPIMLYASHYGSLFTGPSWYCCTGSTNFTTSTSSSIGHTVYLFADLPYVCLPSRRLIIERTLRYSQRERVILCPSFASSARLICVLQWHVGNMWQ